MFSLSSLESESDEDCDVVLLADHEDDPVEVPPVRSESRAAVLSLFSNDEPDIHRHPGTAYRAADIALQVEVKVEVITKEAVARSKRRFSRKWIRERGGKRHTARDFSEIISELRKLR